MKRGRRRLDLCFPFCPASKKPRVLRFPPPAPPRRLPFKNPEVVLSSPSPPAHPRRLPFKNPEVVLSSPSPPAHPRRLQFKNPEVVLSSPSPPAHPRRPAQKVSTLKLFKMGNLSSRYCLPKPKKSSRSSNRGRKPGLGLADWTNFTAGVQRASDFPRNFSPGLWDLERIVGKDGGRVDYYPHVVNRKVVGDARRVVLEALPSLGRKGVKLDVRLTEEKIAIFVPPAEEIEEDLSEPFSPLTNEEEDMVFNAMRYDNRHEVLVIHEASNIEITRKIFQCLCYGAWLNDEVINVYLELLKERENREPKKFFKCHFFNTFFYKKLISEQTGYDFKSVRRWTSHKKLGYSLIECDKIFVPIHKGIHWCLAVINVKDESFQYLDSLGGMDIGILQALAIYFRDEANDKSNVQIDTLSWKQETYRGLPLQNNGWDCGMFMIKYIDFLSRGLRLSFSQEHMMYFRNRTAKEILHLRAE